MKTFLRLLQFSRPYHHYIPEYTVYILLFTIFGLLNFTFLIPLLDILFNTETHKAVTHLPQFSFSISYFKDLFYYQINHYITTSGKLGVLVFVCIILVICAILKNAFGYLGQRVLTRMRVNLIKKMRNDLQSKYTNQSLTFYHNERKGNLLSVISNDVVEVENSVVSSVQTILREPFTIIATFCMLFYLSKELTFFTLIFFPISGFVISSVSKRLKKKSNYSMELLGGILNISEETISGIRIIKAFIAEKFILDKYQRENNKLTKTMKGILNQRELASPIAEILGILVIVIIIIYGGNLILTGKSSLTAAEFIGYIAFYFQIITPAKAIAGAVSYLQRGLSAGERVLRILDTPDTIKEAANAKSIDSFNSAIDFKQVNFSYQNETNVLSNINLSVKKGKMLALVGMSGAGKSTLADLVPRFYDVTEGVVLLDGIDIKNIRIKDLRSMVSIVSQDPVLFNDTVFNNIAFGLTNADPQAVTRAAKAANAHNFIVELENGYDTVIGDRGMKLSGGQRQRLTIARAILKDAPILILDEATSSLDTESERLVQDAINNMMQNRTSIVIAHRLSTIYHADEIVVLNKGEIVETGTHEQLITLNGFYKRLVEMQEVK
jgi:subfamily B ATP-binding cassette protein MsbA